MLYFLILKRLKHSISKRSAFTLFHNRRDRLYGRLIHDIATRFNEKDSSDSFDLKTLSGLLLFQNSVFF